MHAAENVQAIVLSGLDYGDADKIVSLFTLEHGRLKAFARGARKSRKRFGAALEPCGRIEAELRVSEGISSLRSATPVSQLLDPSGGVSQLFHALYCCELVELMTPEGHPLPRLFRLLTAYLEYLPVASSIDSVRRFFEINLLNILGYRPSLDACSSCGIPFSGNVPVSVSDSGEFMCDSCLPRRSREQLGPSSRLKMISALKTGRMELISFDDEELKEVGLLLDRSLSSHCGRKIRTLEFLDY